MVTGANWRTFRWSTGFALAALVTTSPLSAPPDSGRRDGALNCEDQSTDGCGCGVPVDLVRERRLRQLEQHLSERMTGLDPALHEDLALVILEESEAARLDSLLVLAVIEIESGYDPSAVSSVGALGLMQVLPSTKRREVAGPGGQADGVDDPVVNVRAGIRYLRRCLDSYPDLDVALMAYNAGPNRLYGWLQAGAVPGEVRGYARRVLAGQERLRRQLPAEASLRAGAPAAPRLKAAGLSARAG
jgi:hypothetical protein